jgi:protein-S-isoprenylcysteine O-methyltransferase Ste14
MALFCLYWQTIGGGFLQRVYFKLINKPEPAPHFTERWFYKAVRHPIQLGTLIGMWATPAMQSKATE